LESVFLKQGILILADRQISERRGLHWIWPIDRKISVRAVSYHGELVWSEINLIVNAVQCPARLDGLLESLDAPSYTYSDESTFPWSNTT
jgi:hypothetical protein